MSEHTGVPLTDDDHTLLRRATFGAIALVSRADPGFLATFKESMAGSRALQSAPEGVRQLLSEGSLLPAPPAASTPQEAEAAVLHDLTRAVQVLSAKAPGQLVGFRDVVLAAVSQVAAADAGVAPEEQRVIDGVRGALSGGLAGQPPVGDTATDAPRRD